MDIYEVTELKETAFEMKLKSSEDRTTWYNNRLEIDITMNQDLTIIRRSVYNTFSILGDIGGFYGLLFWISNSLLSIINY